MILAKKELEVLYHVIRGTEGKLTLVEGRKRDAFFKGVLEVLKQFEEDRKVIYEKFCDKKEDGTPDTDNGQYTFKKEVAEDLTKELQVLYDETVEVKAIPELKDIFERTEYMPKLGEAEVIDGILAKI